MARSSYRSLAAIVSLDLYGYSRLTEQDEIGTHRALMTCRRSCLEPIVRAGQGVIVKSTGDGALIRFPEAPAAVGAMVRFQEEMAASEACFPPSRRLVFRIGIHFAPTIQEDGDVYGHGVNLAVRLQEGAAPGAILLSGAVATQLDPDASPPLQRLGKRMFKNIEEKVEVYCWPNGEGASKRNGHRPFGLAAAVFLAGMALSTPGTDPIDPAGPHVDKSADALPRDAIGPLEPAMPPTLGTTTLHAAKRRPGDMTALTAPPMLGDGWTGPNQGLLGRPLDAQVKTTMADTERSLESRGEIAEDAYLQAFAFYNRNTPEAFTQAIDELKQALIFKPGHGPAHAMLASIYWTCHQNRWQLGHGLTREGMLRRAMDHLGRTTKPHPLAHMVRSEMLTARGRHGRAVDEAERAIALNPSHAVGHYARGRALLFGGRAQEAKEPIRVAIRLNPHAPRYLFGLALAQFTTNSFDEAARTLARTTARNRDDDWSHLLTAATQGFLGLRAEARQAIGRFDRLSLERRGWFASQVPYVHRWPFRNPDDQDRLHLGMVLAGIPDIEH